MNTFHHIHHRMDIDKTSRLNATNDHIARIATTTTIRRHLK